MLTQPSGARRQAKIRGCTRPPSITANSRARLYGAVAIDSHAGSSPIADRLAPGSFAGVLGKRDPTMERPSADFIDPGQMKAPTSLRRFRLRHRGLCYGELPRAGADLITAARKSVRLSSLTDLDRRAGEPDRREDLSCRGHMDGLGFRLVSHGDLVRSRVSHPDS